MACAFPWNIYRSWRIRPRDRVVRNTVGEKLHDLLEMGAERKGRPLQVVCCRAWDEIGALDLEERRESKDHPPGSLKH